MTVQLSVTASDALDGFQRVWCIWVDQAPGAYQGSGQYANPPNYTSILKAQSTMQENLLLTPGDHVIYFAVTQSGGAAYGSYSGTMTYAPAGGLPTQVPFSGVTATTPAQVAITVPGSTTPPPPTPSISYTTIGLIAVAAVATLLGIGFVARRKK